MLKAQRRLSKREIKEDKFVTFYFQAQEFLQQYRSQILYGCLGIIGVWVAFYVWSSKGLEKESEAGVELAKAQLLYSAGELTDATSILRNLTDQFGDTDSGREAVFYLANASFADKKYKEASEYYQRYLNNGSDEMLLSAALAGMAACLEEQHEYSEAALKYREAAEKYSTGFMAPQQLLHAARCYALAGNIEDARQALSVLLEKYPETSSRNDAEMLLAELAS